MPTSFSTNLALALPATGELSGTWGTTVNSNITNMLDEALGYQAFSATGGSDTLTIPDGTTGVARSIYIQLNGTGGGTVNVPTAKTKMYFVFNNTASAITFKVTGQTGVSIPAAAKIALVSNGTDIITAENYFSALTLGAALPVASGGTSLTTLTANNVILGNGTSAPTFVAPSTTGNVLTSNGTTWASSAPAAGGITYTTTKTSNYTAVANDGVLTNTTAGAFTVNLPASPSNGDQVIVADAAGTWGTNNLTVGRNGNNIADVAQDLVCDISGASVQFVYNSSGTASWEVFAQIGGNGGTAVTLTGTQTLTNKTIDAANNTIVGIGSAVVRSARTANTILAAADNSTLIDITSGTFSQTFTAAATLGSGWFVYLRNSGTGDITLDPNASELIDGLTSYIMYPSEVRLVQCTGTAFTSVVLSPFYRQFNATATFTNPPGYAALSVKCIGGGGGGGSGRRGAAATGRGGGAPGGAPATLMRNVAGIAAGTAITITVGAGGSGGAAQATDSTNGVAGTAGGNTTFGSSYAITAFGGVGGIGGTAANESPRTSGSGSAGVGASAVAVSDGGMPFAASAYGSAVTGFQNNIDEGGGAGNVGCSMWGGAAGAGCNNDVSGGAGSSLRGVSGASGGGAILTTDAYFQPVTAGARGSYAKGGGATPGLSADTPTAGAAGADGDDYIPGAGGAGGGSSKTANAAAGGAGGSPGGGGGGGGASLNATGTSGAGGSGAAGRCIVSGAA
jgi:hypothetical protein